jgi:hypothetical protein
MLSVGSGATLADKVIVADMLLDSIVAMTLDVTFSQPQISV